VATFADKIISFNKSLVFTGRLPKGISLLNPFKDNPAIMPTCGQFYKKYYNDNKPRRMILGINPGRHGAGITGIPFTDTKRLAEFCGINITGFSSHEPSSVFVYDVINSFSPKSAPALRARRFYKRFYINSICPLGFTAAGNSGRQVNYNYYDSPELFKAVYGFIVSSIKRQLGFGIKRDVCFCMGNNANYKHLMLINEREKFFGKIVPLEHPRFIVQYRLKKKQEYIDKYLKALREV
jgi:hypothetical protein